jgi:hypothetical protein
MKKIIVCGDSFCSACRSRPGTHFSELIAATTNYKVINLARGGISNIGICFQLEQAAKLKPNVVIVGRTIADRVDVPSGKSKFNPALGLKNIAYTYQSDTSTGSEYVGNQDSAIYSDMIHNFIGAGRSDKNWQLTDQQRTAVEHYVVYLHDEKFKETTDGWALGYWINVLKSQGVVVIELNKGLGQELYEAYTKNPDEFTRVGYHTDTATQERVAVKLIEYIRNHE